MRAHVSLKSFLYVSTVLLMSIGTAGASTIYVDDDGAADFNTIGAAVEAARSGDTIIIKPGTYAGVASHNIALAGKVLTICGSNLHDPNVIAATVIDCYVEEQEDDEARPQSTTDGEEIDGHRFIELRPDTGTELTLGGLTIINAFDAFAGGAVLCEGAYLKAVNCTFAYNSVEQWGGAIYCLNGSATIENCSFISNSSTKKRGGAVYCENSAVSMTRCNFSQNAGNAIRSSNASMTVVRCTFSENTGESGGAVYCYAASGAGHLGDTVLDHCTFNANTTQTSGGAIYAWGDPLLITGCTFTDNIAVEKGGAIYNYSAAPVITSCMFINNRCVANGGAIANYLQSDPDILNCTFIKNSAVNGGVVTSVRDSHPLVSHCILWSNTATNGPDLYLAQDTYSQGPSEITVEYCDLEHGPAGAYVSPGTTLTWGDGNIDTDPLFTQPATGVYRLSADSPCVDAGDPNYVPAADVMDLDGYRRLFGRTPDIGAYEYQGLSAVYRFWSAVKRKHFYTISGSERDKLLKKYPAIWQYEGVAYWAFYGPSEPDLVPVHRFWSAKLSAHVWTTDEGEKDRLLKEYADTYTYEGIVFYAFPEGRQPLGTVPVYRFWSSRLNYHFYTINEAEKEKLISSYPDVWSYEGIAWYICSRPYQLQETTYDFAGGVEETAYTMTLSAYVDGKGAEIDFPEIVFTPNASEMQMTIEFSDRQATLEHFRVETLLTDHAARIYPSDGVSIPFTVATRATFECVAPQGPFRIDAASGVFADFVDSNLNLAAEDAVYSYNGRVTFADREVNINATAEALNFDLESYGIFESLDQLPNNVDAYVPETFQWSRPHVKDLLVETTVKGRLVQIYVTHMHVGTQGQWAGQALD